MAALPVRSCILDGKAIVCNDDGLAVFDLIRGHERNGRAILCAFDLIEVNGEDLRPPIEERKRRLAGLLQAPESCSGAMSTRAKLVTKHLIDAPPVLLFDRAMPLKFAGVALLQLVRLCDEADIPTKGRRPSIPGRVTCALIIVEAWHMVRGRAPAHNNDEAQEVCEDYWRACGGSKGSTIRWQKYLKDARAVRVRRGYVCDAIRGGLATGQSPA